MKLLKYDLEKFNFPALIASFLNVESLADMKAEKNEAIKNENSLYKNMEQSKWYKLLYSKLNSGEGEAFYEMYEKFIQEVIRPQYPEAIFYQARPTHRIHFSNGSGISRFHRDSDYGHNLAEVNYSVPQTPAFDTNAIWIESEEGKADFQPMNMQPGQYAEFKGCSLMHGARKNETGATRVSFDFRVMPVSAAPDVYTDQSKWSEQDKQNPLFLNAHQFVICN
ncbi:MAG: hypothetical protein WD077_06840 [Bacteroidia bacterium]